MGGLISGIFDSPKTPAPAPAPAAPTPSQAATDPAVTALNNQRAAASGMESTLLTSGKGADEDAANVSKPTLLGE